MISQYLNQCWPISLTHICGTRGRWVSCVLQLVVCPSHWHNYKDDLCLWQELEEVPSSAGPAYIQGLHIVISSPAHAPTTVGVWPLTGRLPTMISRVQVGRWWLQCFWIHTADWTKLFKLTDKISQDIVTFVELNCVPFTDASGLISELLMDQSNGCTNGSDLTLTTE